MNPTTSVPGGASSAALVSLASIFVLGGLAIAGWQQAGSDGQPPAEGAWPTTVDPAARTLTALVSHFSTQTVSADPATIVPATIEEFQVGLFSGSASFALPLALPPGAAGLKPSLTLQYHCATVNTMYTRYSQGGWLGIGWSLELGVVRWTDGQGDPYAIVMDGVSGQLRSENRTARSAPGAYHPRRENWVKVQFSEGRGVNQGRWEVWTTDGTKYTFGSTSASRLWTCTGTEAWKLDTITDPAGNTIEIQYQTITLNDGKNRCGSPNESYPATIRYTKNAGAATAEFTIEFAISTRPSTKSSGTLLYETRKLDAIRLKNAAGQIVREWTFAYATVAPPYPPTTQEGKDVLLTQLTPYGAGGAALGPGNALPALTFEYDRYDPANGINETRTLDWCLGQLTDRCDRSQQ